MWESGKRQKKRNREWEREPGLVEGDGEGEGEEFEVPGPRGKKRRQPDKEKLKQNSVKFHGDTWPKDIWEPEGLPDSFEVVCITTV